MRRLWVVGLFAVIPTLAAEPSLPPDCAHLDFAETGRPVMSPARDGFAYGISFPHRIFFRRESLSARDTYIPIRVWMDNQTNQEQMFDSCGPTHEWIDTTGQWQSAAWPGVEVFDAHGRRRAGSILHSVCAADFRSTISAHTCSGSKLDGFELTAPLPPGRYFFTERAQGLPIARRAGLWITIQDKRR